MALPVLLLLYIGGYVITDMIGCSRKVTVATRELTDMATRSAQLTTAQVSTILGAAQQVMVPYDYSKATVTLNEVQVVDSTHVKVVWSQSANGTARTQWAAITVNAGLIPAYLLPTDTAAQSICTDTTTPAGSAGAGNGGCLILGEVAYAYKPVMGLGAVTTTNLGDAIYLSPRVSSSIPLLP